MGNKGKKLAPRSPGQCAGCGQSFAKERARETYCSISCAVWSRVDKRGPGECWPWTGGTVGPGYGAGTFNQKRYRASRVILSEKLGRELAADVFALHRCDNPPCCNPSHLFSGSNADNMADKAAKGRGRGISPALKGEAHGKAKLTAEAVSFMRANAEIGCVELGKMFGVPKDAAWKVLHRKTWKHLP